VIARISTAALLACALCLLLSAASLADNGPMQKTTEGISPGVSNPTVRMADENVDINVVEHDGAVHEIVSATFDMFNRGPDVALTTGFPGFNFYLVPGGLAGFLPADIADFHVASGTSSFQPTSRRVQLSADDAGLFGDNWFVWDMAYPGGTMTTVKVNYDQTIQPTTDGFAYVGYVLNTGALWDGTIGDAVITFHTSGGGGFLQPTTADRQVLSTRYRQSGGLGVPDQPVLPSSESATQIVWHLTDIKPAFDPFGIYVPAAVWQTLGPAESAVGEGSLSGRDYAAAAAAEVDLVGRAADSGLPAPFGRRGGLLPQALVDRLVQARDWAQQATTLDSTNPAGFEALGDVLFTLEARPFLGGACKPVVAQPAFQQAVDLGSATAQAKLDAANSQGTAIDGVTQLPDCSGEPRSAVDGVGAPAAPSAAPAAAIDASPPSAPDTLDDGVRGDILSAVNRANAAWVTATQSLDPGGLSDAVAGQELTNDLAEVDSLKQKGQSRHNVNIAFTVDDVTLDAPGHAIVHTHESWYAEILDQGSGQLLQRTPPQAYTETYTVEYQNGGWIVTQNLT
jgi:hypothetical protein